MCSHATIPDSSPENTSLRCVWEDRAVVITVAGVASLPSGGEAMRSAARALPAVGAPPDMDSVAVKWSRRASPMTKKSRLKTSGCCCPGSQRRKEENTKERMCLFNKVLQDEFLLLV